MTSGGRDENYRPYLRGDRCDRLLYIERRIRFAKGPAKAPTHDAAYWERVTTGMNFAEADQVPTMLFNRVLWKGLKGNQPYPTRN